MIAMLQQTPRAEFDRRVTEVDRAIGGIKRGTTEIERHDPPQYSAPTRQGVEAIVDGLVTNLCAKINELHRVLDVLGQRAITSGAKSKAALAEHVETCERVNAEIAHISDVVAQLDEDSRAAS
jgi:hypothetical protein